MQLRNVLFTHHYRKGTLIPQSGIKLAIPTNVCADSIFKLAFTLCFKQDSICKDFQRGLIHYMPVNDMKNKEK